MEYEKFYDQVKKMGVSNRITIPNKLCKFMGIKPGDQVMVMIKKVEE